MMRRCLRGALLASLATSLTFEGVKNARRLSGAAQKLPVLRTATLDNATQSDAAALLDLVVIDLRNEDEVAKGARKRSDAARDFYARREPSLRRRPLLGDIDGFWTAVAEEAPPLLWPRVALLWSARPLNAALSRALEDGGNAMLYKAILASAPRTVGKAVLDVVDGVEGGETVLFHCQKGKDRTGIVAALLEEVCGVDRAETVAAYAASGGFLGGEDALPPAPAETRGLSDDPEVDWSRFRGSPPEAIEQTLAWLDARHGGAARYLATQCGVPEAKLATLRRLAAEA